MNVGKAEKSCSLGLLATTISQSPKIYGWITLEYNTDRIREGWFNTGDLAFFLWPSSMFTSPGLRFSLWFCVLTENLAVNDLRHMSLLESGCGNSSVWSQNSYPLSHQNEVFSSQGSSSVCVCVCVCVYVCVFTQSLQVSMEPDLWWGEKDGPLQDTFE